MATTVIEVLEGEVKFVVKHRTFKANVGVVRYLPGVVGIGHNTLHQGSRNSIINRETIRHIRREISVFHQVCCAAELIYLVVTHLTIRGSQLEEVEDIGCAFEETFVRCVPTHHQAREESIPMCLGKE